MDSKQLLLIILIALVLLLSAPATMALEHGDVALQFSANSTTGRISLTNFVGDRSVVLALYFAIFTPAWTDEVIAFQRDLEEFNKMGAQVIGVSSDSMEKNLQFADKNGITFPLASDEDKQIKKLYGKGRVTYIIEKNGVIQYKKRAYPTTGSCWMC